MANEKTAPDTTTPKASADDNLPPITLSIMKLVVETLAGDIEDDQARRVEYGWRKAPDPAKLEEARVLRKIGELIKRIGESSEARAALGLRTAKTAGNCAP